MAIGDYKKIGWSPDTLKPVSSVNLQKIDVKLEELDAHLSNMIVLGNAIKGDIGPVGPKGDKGDKGDQGIQGERGVQGEPGITVPNINGLSTIDSVDLANDSMIVYDVSTSLHKKVSPSTFGIHNHNNKLILDDITSIKVSNWDTAYTNNHVHSNKANLDSINQNLSTTSSPTFITVNGNLSGNASSATNLSTTRSNWTNNGVLSAVVGQLSWKNYGNGHTIIDASAGTAPDGTTIDKSNSGSAWTANYPTLMGWNGSSTYGVRVDSCRISDSASNCTHGDLLSKRGNSYYQAQTWIQFTDAHGLYCPTVNGAHFYANNATSYGTWLVSGTRGGYSGICVNSGGSQTHIMSNGTDCGIYNQGDSKWLLHTNRSSATCHYPLYGAVGNDFADKLDFNNDKTEPGYCISYFNHKTKKTNKRNDRNYIGVVSDTAAITAGNPANKGQPVAVAGFVLAYLEDRKYESGDKLTVSKNGKLTRKHFWEETKAIYICELKDDKWNNVEVKNRKLVRVL